MLALPLLKEEFNAIMSIICKFSKQVTLVKDANTWSAEQWAYTFLKRLDLIDWGYPRKLIIDCDQKFLNKFWIVLFVKLGVKLFYNIAYHSQINGASEQTNQTIKIALQFFVHAIDNLSQWPEVLLRIQSLLNNISFSTIGKTSNKIAYGFLPRKPLNLYSAATLPDIYVAYTGATDAISFALANHKEYYNRNHQPLFIKIGDWAIIKLYKGYSIPSSVGVTKKLTQQYVGPVRIIERVGRLAYKLDVPNDWKIHLVFFVTQLEPAPSLTKNPFQCPHPQHSPFIFVKGDTDYHKSFEIINILNKRAVKKHKGLVIKYLVCWTGYDPEWDR